MEDSSLENTEVKPVSTDDESNCTAKTDPNVTTSKECSAAGSSLVPKVSTICVVKDQPTATPEATPVSAESRSADSLIVLPTRLPIQEQSRGALNNAILQRLKELMNGLNHMYESLVLQNTAVLSSTNIDEIRAGTTSTAKEMENTVIKAVQTLKTEMDDKMKQWFSATNDVAKAITHASVSYCAIRLLKEA